MKIAVIGTRGIPTKQGGVERHVEELYQRIALNHEVTVYCRNSYTPKELDSHKGIKLRHLPNVNTKHFDAITHTFLSSVDAIFRDFDIIHFHAIGPCLLSFIPKLNRKAKIVATVHALDWQRAKWTSFAINILKAGERASVTFPDLTISVSKTIQSYLKKKYDHPAVYIPNGISNPQLCDPKLINNFSLEKGNYILFLGMLEPEKNCDLLIKAFKQIKTDKKLVIAGGPNHTQNYYKELQKCADGDQRIVFTGTVTGKLLNELYSNAFIFVLPSKSEGLPVVLLEAMSYGLPVLCSDIKPNIEIVGNKDEYALTFKTNDLNCLKKQLSKMLISQNGMNKKAKSAKNYVINNYNWDTIAKKTEDVYQSLVP